MASVSANGSRSTTVYDSAGRTVASINPLGKRWTTIYNSVGQTVGSKDPLGNRSTSVYDTAGRVVASINPLGKRTTTIYNIASQTLASVDANGNRVSSVYDALGRRRVEVNALGNRTTTVYNAIGQTSALVDARGNRHSFTYDQTGAQTQLIDPLNRRTTSGYAMPPGSRHCVSMPAGIGRPTRSTASVGFPDVADPDGSRVTFSYDGVGNRTLMADSTGRYTSTYDLLGQTAVTKAPNSQAIHTRTMPSVRRDQSKPVAPVDRRFPDDAAGRMSSLRNANNERTTYTYDDSGRRTVQRNSNGTRKSSLCLRRCQPDNTSVSSHVSRSNNSATRLPLR
ncbi:MAG UNVERIFIED_CONTAM: hypothetical protein LVR18_20045 [Planctomycetaceae bacterium]